MIRGDYSVFPETTHTKALKFTETSAININTLSNPVVTIWNQGSSGLQILDYSDVISQLYAQVVTTLQVLIIHLHLRLYNTFTTW